MELTNQDYLRATGIRLVRGRWLAESDREDAPPIVTPSESAARALFPDRDALGERVNLWGERQGPVVGIVADARYREFLEPGATVGLLFALAASGLLRALLYGVAPSDPVSLAASALSMLIVCAAAVTLPAWKAGQTDPARELRGE